MEHRLVKGGDFQRFPVRVPLVQICAKLELLTGATPPERTSATLQQASRMLKSQKAESTNARRSPRRKPKTLQLIGSNGRRCARIAAPQDDLPEVVLWADRVFIKSTGGANYLERAVYRVPA